MSTEVGVTQHGADALSRSAKIAYKKIISLIGPLGAAEGLTLLVNIAAQLSVGAEIEREDFAKACADCYDIAQRSVRKH